MRVQFSNLNKAPEYLKSNWLTAVKLTIDGGSYINGPQVELFENEFAREMKVSHAIGVSNGLDGLELALRSIGIGPGHTVGVPAHTFIATWLAVVNVGARPRGIDVDDDGLMDLEIFRSQSPDLDCVIPVHMHGSTVDITKLRRMSKNNNIKIVEDASQAHFASTDGVLAGSLGDVSVFSLYPTKNLGALGDAGIIVTNNSELSKEIKSKRDYGSVDGNKYKHITLGRNCRLDEIQASILRVNLRHIEEWNNHRQKLASRYIDKLANYRIKIFQENRGDSIRHHFCVLVSNRDKFRETLSNFGISTDIHYPYAAADEIAALTKQEQGVFPKAQHIARHILSLPLSQWHTEEEIDYVCKIIGEVWNSEFHFN